ncbi:hypothetical protein AYK24_10425 [Thermoplasmatales archaeon SG8-52-4]|nr:MAG: hypothetical protein AYK24_10425 [Thermoplasmatales archaeon SG8-52-4]
MHKRSYARFWEIDFFRGIAIIMMIIFHFLYDLNYLNIFNLSLYSGYFLIYVYLVGITFFLLVGISLTLSYSKVKETLPKNKLILKYLIRGFKIFSLGLIITIITFLILKEGFVVFGVLHCIGISIILSYPFLKLRYLNLLFGLILICFGIILKILTFDFYFLIWLGFRPEMFYTIDYFPLLPWFGIILIGIFLGNTFYNKHIRRINLTDLSTNRFVRFFTFLGKHSLIIYFIHQPIILLILYLYLSI